MTRPCPTTVGELAEICQHVTSPGTWLELNARAFRIRLERNAGGDYWRDVPQSLYNQPLDEESQECYEKILTEWREFRDAMTKVFGE